MTRTVMCQWPRTPAAAGAMNTRRFLIHCRGRMPRERAAERRARRPLGDARGLGARDPRSPASLPGGTVRRRHEAAADMVMKSRAHHDWK